MNSKVIAIIVVGLFVTCCFGSFAAAGLYVVAKGAEASRTTTVAGPVARRTTSPLPEEPSPPDEALPPEEEPVPAPEYRAPDAAAAEFAVFHLAPLKTPARRALTVALKGRSYRLMAGADFAPDAPSAVTLEEASTEDYEVLKDSYFDMARGLSEADKRHLADSRHVSVLRFRGPVSVQAAKDTAAITAAFAKATGGIIWDEEVREYLSLAEFTRRRLDSWEGPVPHVSLTISLLMSDEDDGLGSLTSAGLRHAGLPEVRLESIPRSSMKSAGNLLNALAQHLVEDPAQAAPGAGRLDLTSLKHAAHRAFLEDACFEGAGKSVDYELSPFERAEGPVTLRLEFPGDGAPSERVKAALDAVFGSNDEVSQVEHDDELQALSAKQMAVFDTVWVKRFKKGLKSGEVLMVKAPFVTSAGGNEWMWVEVTKLGKDGSIEGVLSNEPSDVPDLRSGSLVTVKRAELFDWSFTEADGTLQGNETGKVMLRRQGKEPDW
jgi:uncharacterized protein YegJ (DUF2314 family)